MEYTIVSSIRESPTIVHWDCHGILLTFFILKGFFWPITVTVYTLPIVLVLRTIRKGHDPLVSLDGRVGPL